MKFSVTRFRNLGEDLAQDSNALHEIAQAAVIDTTDDTQRAMRLQVATRIGNKVAGAVRQKLFTRSDRGVVGFVYSNWWGRAANGKPIDIFKQFELGSQILPRHGEYLAIPMPVVGRTGRGRRLTPREWEQRHGQELHFVKRPGAKNAVLIARHVRIGQRGTTIGKVRFGRRGRLIGTKYQKAVVVYVLVRSSKLPRQLDGATLRAEMERTLARNLVVRLGQAGL